MKNSVNYEKYQRELTLYIDIKGRSKNVIITSNGKNVYPEEIEELLTENEVIRQAVVSQKENKISY